jgi:exodeoxyribonuclease V alpha subunit
VTEVRLVQRARQRALLAGFNAAGVLEAADVHVALRLGALGGENDEQVLLAAALAVRAVRLGSVCVDLNRLREVTVEDPRVDVAALPWPAAEAVEKALRASPLVAGSARGRLTPLRLADTREGPLLYLDRYWRQEQTIRHALAERDRTRPPGPDAGRLAELFGGPAPDRQRIGAALAASRWTSVLAGGPGTGKTHTVARVLALLNRPGLRVALAAPTGKAAARLQEVVRAQAAELGLPELTATTLHRLLGWRSERRTRFRHDATHRLPYDVVVVDESSMVSLTLMARLMEALRPQTRLILVGDPDQLTSVEAGAVLGDLVARPTAATEVDAGLRALIAPDLHPAGPDPQEAALGPAEQARLAAGIVRLSRGRRFGGVIAELAVAIRNGDADRALELLHSGTPTTGDPADHPADHAAGDPAEDRAGNGTRNRARDRDAAGDGRADAAGEPAGWIELVPPDDVDGVRADVVRADAGVRAAAEAGDVEAALHRLEQHRLLCAHREGPFGVEQWSRLAQEWVHAPFDEWYAGQPLLVTTNDHEARIYNGDTGVVVDVGPAGERRLTAAFARGDEPLLLPPTLLIAVQTVHAMTIHRSQGSQYDAVTVILPPPESSLLTRELLYTAVTRARRRVRLLGTDEALRAGIGRRVLRASGLQRSILRVSGAAGTASPSG